MSSPPLPLTTPALRVLFVDDNALVRESMRECIEVLGHQVVDVASAEEALVRLSQQGFDVLLSDLNLPGLSGIELARKVAEQHPTVHTLLSSGVGGSLDLARYGIRAGWLPKPLSMDTLEQALRDIARHGGPSAAA
ncbi:response regulator [Aquabacterium sp. J223]|uniref:response regulator n=1 Tax=Aquabacterium sp. J223 TaxID=2898431 RepID=UPI0021ADC7B2|nr:response regulator [Aquabacterium sp. J223]UUX96874.1 response regulator [Aquabacterium sp. J223]